MQTADVDAATTLLYAPDTHGLHEKLSARLAYAPAAHTVQTADVFAPVTSLYEPGAQVVHSSVDRSDLYEPTGHAVQPVVPVIKLLYCPALQVVHAADVAAARVLYLPAGHAVHSVVPDASKLYAPAAHAAQARDEVATDRELNLPALQAVQALVPVVRAL